MNELAAPFVISLQASLAAAHDWIEHYRGFWESSVDALADTCETSNRRARPHDRHPSDPAQFAVWFGGHNAPLEDVVMDVRAGGAWSDRMVLEAAMRSAGAASSSSLDEPSRVVLALTDAPEEDRGEPLAVDLETSAAAPAWLSSSAATS